MNIPWIPIAVGVGVIAIVALIAYLFIQSNQDDPPNNEAAQAIENDATAEYPGEYVDLPTAWAEGDVLAHYGEDGGAEAPNTNAHVQREVDYSKETSANSTTGLPPVGGPHWGQGACGEDPDAAGAFCGPVPWGIYFDPWPAESLVHNMEHSGVVVWYNTSDTEARDRLRGWVEDRLDADKLVVMAAYPDMPADTIALTAWTRRDVFPVSEMTEDRVKDFIDKLACRFNPENIPCG